MILYWVKIGICAANALYRRRCAADNDGDDGGVNSGVQCWHGDQMRRLTGNNGAATAAQIARRKCAAMQCVIMQPNAMLLRSGGVRKKIAAKSGEQQQPAALMATCATLMQQRAAAAPACWCQPSPREINKYGANVSSKCLSTVLQML